MICAERWDRDLSMFERALAAELFFDAAGQLVLGRRVARIDGRAVVTPLILAFSGRSSAVPREKDGIILADMLAEKRKRAPRPAEAAGDTEEGGARA